MTTMFALGFICGICSTGAVFTLCWLASKPKPPKPVEPGEPPITWP